MSSGQTLPSAVQAVPGARCGGPRGARPGTVGCLPASGAAGSNCDRDRRRRVGRLGDRRGGGAVPAVAGKQGAQLAVRDVRPLPAGDPNGISLFFFMVACTLGGLLAVTATGMAAPALRPRYRWPLIGAAAVADRGLGAIGRAAGAAFALLGVAALYVLAVAVIARGLQLILGFRLALMAGTAVFIMFNFPSGASIQGAMLPAFWHVLNRFWIGASASDAFRGIVYVGGQGAGTGVLKLLGWLAVGVVLLALDWLKLQRGRQEVMSAGTDVGAPEPLTAGSERRPVRVADSLAGHR